MSDQPSEAPRPPEDPKEAGAPRPPEPPTAASEAAGTPAHQPDPTAARSAGAPAADTARQSAVWDPAPSQTSGDPRARAQATGKAGPPGNPWQYGAGVHSAEDNDVTARIRPPAPPLIGPAVLGSVLATALLSALFLGDGLGVNLLIVAVPAALAAFFAAQGRQAADYGPGPRPGRWEDSPCSRCRPSGTRAGPPSSRWCPPSRSARSRCTAAAAGWGC
ncbi:hypothetical protein RB201_25470 [Streptomyces sp. S1A(2023)]